LKFVEVCTGVHADVHLHEAGLGFETEVCGSCAIAVVVGLTAVAVWILEEVDLLELAWGDEDVVFCDDWVVVFHVFCS
jgi:diaminopimelate epimerase